MDQLSDIEQGKSWIRVFEKMDEATKAEFYPALRASDNKTVRNAMLAVYAERHGD